MPTYIRKTIKLLPWVTLNINKSGTSLSIGPRGAKLNISKKGVYFNSNIRGTGIYNKTKVGTSLLWGLGTAAAIIAIGYALGIALQNFQLFVTLFIAAIPIGIIAFFIANPMSPYYKSDTFATILQKTADMPRYELKQTENKLKIVVRGVPTLKDAHALLSKLR